MSEHDPVTLLFDSELTVSWLVVPVVYKGAREVCVLKTMLTIQGESLV